MYKKIFSFLCTISPLIQIEAAQDHEAVAYFSLPRDFFVQQNDIMVTVLDIKDLISSLENSNMDTEKVCKEKLKELEEKLDKILKLFEEKTTPANYHETWQPPVKKGDTR